MPIKIVQSVYIPRIVFRDDIGPYIRYVIESVNKLGIIETIDFIPMNKKRGFNESFEEGNLISVFVHFRSVNNDAEIWRVIASGSPYRVDVSENEYWLFLQNKNPVKRTLMNIHQVVDNGLYLEGLIEAQSKLIEEQSKTIANLQNELRILKEDLDTYGILSYS